MPALKPSDTSPWGVCEGIADCPLCERPNLRPSDHHLVPKSRGGRGGDKVLICRDCHSAIHALFSNKELEKSYTTVDALLANERFAKMVRFIARQDPHRRTHTALASDQRRRGRNG